MSYIDNDFADTQATGDVMVTIWRWLLPLAFVVALIAVLWGITTNHGGPAWVFAAALGMAALGLASLVAYLVGRGRDIVGREVDEFSDQIRDVFDGDDGPKRG